ncbi:MAG: type II/IV secretion system protein, partial [Rhodothermales bacterium]|nr:type II/IV secretion system protein [Rhodothermales bacterium]
MPDYLSFEYEDAADPLDPTPLPEEKAARQPDQAEQELIDLIFERFGHDRVIKALIVNTDISAYKIQEAIHALQKRGSDEALWRVLTEIPGVNRESIFSEAASVYAFKHEKIEPGRPDHDFVELMMETVGEEQRDEMVSMRLLPFEHTLDFETGSGRIVFVTHDPSRPEVSKLLHSLDVGRFELRYAPEPAIKHVLDELFPQKNEFLERMSEGSQAFDLGTSYEQEVSEVDEDALEAEISRSKLLNLFEATLVEAVRQGVSDVHIFPNPNRQVEILFRLDGRLKRWHVEDKVHPEAFLAVVKDNAINVDRFEREKAQDGYIQRQVDGTLIRFRVSTLPIASANAELRAESIVIRILDDRKVLTDITKLGMLDVALERFEKAIRLPYGMIILTGPTGSGKSTTLVAALHQVINPEVNVLTVEDPVEYIIKGVRQIKLNHKLDNEGAMRAILRHDPDIVMVGEMRDRETAELAIKLANTGHLTFSTLHTNDAPSAISRLYKMGIEPFLLAYAINMVVAQRLIREVCPKCKSVEHDVDEVMLRSMGFSDSDIEETTFYKAGTGSGCTNCNNSGFKGRRAICETLYFSREIRNMIAESGDEIDEDKILKQALKEGMLTLQDSARELVKMGVTSIDEM